MKTQGGQFSVFSGQSAPGVKAPVKVKGYGARWGNRRSVLAALSPKGDEVLVEWRRRGRDGRMRKTRVVLTLQASASTLAVISAVLDDVRKAAFMDPALGEGGAG